MELKLTLSMVNLFMSRLLIVPYGIETHQIGDRLHRQELLIVPYGIETTRQTIGKAY